MLDFIRGAVAMGFLVAAGFFIRFWRQTRDRLFCLFAIAFVLISANNALQTVMHESVQNNILPYVIRLLAFLIIALAIIDKNVRPSNTR